MLTVATAAKFALPRHVIIERSAVIEAAPDAVIELAASNSGYLSFNPLRDLDPNLQVEFLGSSSGVGSGFSFESKESAGQQIVAAVASVKVTFALDLGPLGQPIQAISAVGVDGATAVT